MGYVHHSEYANYLEEARMEYLKLLGVDCNEMEKRGIILPVVSMEIRFVAPLFFGDVLTLDTRLIPPIEPKLQFHYKGYNQAGKMVCRARISLVAADGEKGTIVPMPDQFRVFLEEAIMN